MCLQEHFSKGFQGKGEVVVRNAHANREPCDDEEDTNAPNTSSVERLLPDPGECMGGGDVPDENVTREKTHNHA